MNTQRQFDVNDDQPYRASGPQNADNFEDTDIGDCRAYQGIIYDEDHQVYADETENSVFSIVVPYRDSDNDEMDAYDREPADYAYWEVRKIRDAIYGGVYEGKLLKRLHTHDGSVKWVKTSTMVAIKKLNCDHVMREANTSAERPMEEIKAMQYLQHHIAAKTNNSQENLTSDDIRQRAEQGIMEHHIMTSIDVITDNVNLYLVMPFCDGREMFDVVQEQKFSEPEARYWFKQILNAVGTLQEAGVCHRDMSLENMMVSGAGVLAIVIDFGMAIKIPYITDQNGFKQRCLIRPDRACGKDYYMSPEIRRNNVPFDGHAIDMWALGPMLFMMVCGFPPWDTASSTDEKFRYCSSGYFVQLASHWNLGLSSDLMDLMQRMFWFNPNDRLSLGQVRDHPWMNGPVQRPESIE